MHSDAAVVGWRTGAGEYRALQYILPVAASLITAQHSTMWLVACASGRSTIIGMPAWNLFDGHRVDDDRLKRETVASHDNGPLEEVR